MLIIAKIRDWLKKPNTAQPRECAQCGRSAVFLDAAVSQWFCTKRCGDKWKLEFVQWIRSGKE